MQKRLMYTSPLNTVYRLLPYLLEYNHVVSKCSILLAHTVTNIFQTCPQVVCGIAAQPYKYIKS